MTAKKNQVMANTCAMALVAANAFAAASAETVAWFQKTEQARMDAVAAGDKAPWERTLDAEAVMTSEEGEVISRADLLASLRGLPPGLKGTIAVRELTVQELPSVAVVRFLADESETVF